MLKRSWLRCVAAFVMVLTGVAWAMDVTNSTFESGTYNGKNGPVSMRDVDWWGPLGTANTCWWERDASGNPKVRHCGELQARYCAGINAAFIGLSPGSVCDPRKGVLCVADSDSQQATVLNLATEHCVKGKWGNTININVVEALANKTLGKLTNGTPVASPYNCIIGLSCGVLLDRGSPSAVYIYVDNNMAKGTDLAIRGPAELFVKGPINGLSNGSACKHLINCQRMLNGDVYPMGIGNPLGLAHSVTVVAGTELVPLPGIANALAAGANGALWAIGVEPTSGGFGIYRMVNDNWEKTSGGAEKIAVDGQGFAWVITSAKAIFRWNGSGFVQQPGGAMEIAVNGKGNAFALGVNPVPGGYQPLRWDGKGWVGMPGGLIRIAVEPTGNPWGINAANQIFRWNGTGWEGKPGAATAIGIGENGSVFIVGTDAVLYKWNGSGWERRPGTGLKAVSVDGRGVPWVLATDGKMYMSVP